MTGGEFSREYENRSGAIKKGLYLKSPYHTRCVVGQANDLSKLLFELAV